jgi:hypothetical protein
MPHCEHFGTGYSLVRWMEENDCWPLEKPAVHSANLVGRAKMKAVIEQKFRVTRSRDATPEQFAQKVVRVVQVLERQRETPPVAVKLMGPRVLFVR